MVAGPNISIIGGLIGDPARAAMLNALMSGRALTATELAQSGGVTAQTASSHLSKLVDGGLLTVRKQGRHRYFALAGDDVASMLEAMMGLALKTAPPPVRTGPRDPRLRNARICYDHLAGDMGVELFNALVENGMLQSIDEAVLLTDAGALKFREFGIDIDALRRARRPTCRACLDWSARRIHLAGGLGAAILARFTERKWAWRIPDTRIIEFSPEGRKQYKRLCSL